MFLLAGSATLREGIESVLFLTGVSAGSSIKAVIFPGLLGILIGSLLGFLVYYTGHSIRSLKWFFIASAALLLIISSGMVVNGTAFFQNAGLFGAMWPYEYRPWANKIMWDTSGCCNPNTNEGWALMRALFGYQAIAMNIQLLYYCMYWALTLALLWYKWYHGTLTDAREAKLADQESFNRHALEDLGLEEGSSDGEGKVSSLKASSDDLEAGVKDGLGRTSPGDSAGSLEGVTTTNPAAAAAVKVLAN
jgi:high-affinity iron transporter